MGLRIALLTTWHVRCGIAAYSESLARALAGLGVEVYVVRMPRFGQRTAELLKLVAESVPVDKVDLIHVQNEFGLLQGLDSEFYQALQGLGRPVVSTLHATGIWEREQPVCAVSKRIIVHNEHMKRLLSCPERAVVIPHGCEPRQPMDRGEARRSFGVPERAKMVGYCGFISPVKGLETAVEAVAALPGVGLLVGGGWHTEAETVYMQGFREKALGLLKGRVSFTGYVPDERLAAFYGAVDVCVYPSRFVSESGALLMALSYGKAVIARRLPPTFEKQVAGALLTFRDATDLSRKIKRLLRDEGLRRRVEEGAKAWVEKNSWSRVAEKHISVYNEIVREEEG